MTAEIRRLMQPMQAKRRSDPEFVASHLTYYSLMIGTETIKLALATYIGMIKLFELKK